MSQQDSCSEAKGARTGYCWPQLLRPLSWLMFSAKSLLRKVFHEKKKRLKVGWSLKKKISRKCHSLAITKGPLGGYLTELTAWCTSFLPKHYAEYWGQWGRKDESEDNPHLMRPLQQRASLRAPAALRSFPTSRASLKKLFHHSGCVCIWGNMYQLARDMGKHWEKLKWTHFLYQWTLSGRSEQAYL